jgi:hypothetical protein
MKNSILRNWTFARILHLIIGIVIICEAIYRRDMVSGLGGLIFSGMGIYNISFWGSGGCYMPVKKTKENHEETNYKEVI